MADHRHKLVKITSKFQLFPVLAEQSFISNSRNDDKLTQMESKKITELRDPLFVITTSLKIMKHQSTDSELNPEIKRMETALSRIEKIIR